MKHFIALSIGMLPLLFGNISSAKHMSISDDLNADGTNERIEIQQGNEHWKLKIGSKTKNIEHVDELNNCQLKIMDINKNDSYHEIVAYGELAGGHGGSYVFGYDGKKIRSLGVFSSVSTNGNGIVYNRYWHNFYTRVERYRLDRPKWRLTSTPQDMYSVNISVTVRKSFAIQLSLTDPKSKMRVKKESRVTILLLREEACTNPRAGKKCEWFLIRTSTGLLGWARFSTFGGSVDGITIAG